MKSKNLKQNHLIKMLMNKISQNIQIIVEKVLFHNHQVE